jgi:hypothetical protein
VQEKKWVDGGLFLPQSFPSTVKGEPAMEHELKIRLPSEIATKIVELSRLEDRSINKTVKRLLEKALNDDKNCK